MDDFISRNEIAVKILLNLSSVKNEVLAIFKYQFQIINTLKVEDFICGCIGTVKILKIIATAKEVWVPPQEASRQTMERLLG